MILKTKINAITLTGGVTYDTVTDSAIPLWQRIFFFNNTGADLYYKINDLPASGGAVIPDQSAFDSISPSIDCSFGDVIKVNGSGTIQIEIQYIA